MGVPAPPAPSSHHLPLHPDLQVGASPAEGEGCFPAMPFGAAGAGRAQGGAGAAHSRGEKCRQEGEQEKVSLKGFGAPECPDAQTGPQGTKVKRYP